MNRSILHFAFMAMICTALTAQAQVGKREAGSVLDPNVATEAELAADPNLNATIAKALIEKRPFLAQADLNAFLVEQKLTPEQLVQTYGKLFLHINLNTAADEEIRMIPNLGPRMLREFKEYRPYKTMEQFRREMGKYVNAAEVARLEQYVFVPINLNTASDEDIMTIPGLGQRMLREFKEYRPYTSMEQFRKEIGKYVNAKELSRLERYVTLEK
jgi:DNA uptake protein ComE-like DNA-binding protein